MAKMTEHGLHPRGSETSIGTRTHEKVGADFLRQLGFPLCVLELVEGHVKAKRYLVYKYAQNDISVIVYVMYQKLVLKDDDLILLR